MAFNVEHGCDGSPTIELEIKVPDDVVDPTPVEKEGWTTDVAQGIVLFTGGSLPADKEDTFSIKFTAPSTNGALVFPSIQKCTVGQINWIQPTVEGQPDPVTGMVLDLKELKEILEREVMHRMDHRFLNYEVAELEGQIPTCENVARVIWNLLEPKIPQGRLHRVRLYESADLFADCYRNGAGGAG